MTQQTLFDPHHNELTLAFDGATYHPKRDHQRLSSQLDRVYEAMKDGSWHTLKELAAITGDPESSISARIRDFNKEKFQPKYQCKCEREFVSRGLHRYRLIKGA